MFKRLVIFASGSGSNAENIIRYFLSKKSDVQVPFVITNNSKALVINKCKSLAVPVFVLKNVDFEHPDTILSLLTQNNIDLIVLAGFLRKIHPLIVERFPNRIINIHPSLLPQYGGPGMYGIRVHQAVINAAEKQSGITIHYVNENYDDGTIIFKATCELAENETPTSLAEKILKLEHHHFPLVLEQLLQSK